MLPAAQVLAEPRPQPDPEIPPQCDQVGGVSASSQLSSLQGSVQASGNGPGHRTSAEREGGPQLMETAGRTGDTGVLLGGIIQAQRGCEG